MKARSMRPAFLFFGEQLQVLAERFVYLIVQP
jgi:hypothetical protein